MKTNLRTFFSRKQIRENLPIAKMCLATLFLLSVCTSCNNSKGYELHSLKLHKGWGYTISLHNKIVIRQGLIPVIADNKSFYSEKDALKTGNLVVRKLTQGLPPTLTKKDLILLEITM